MRTPAVGALLVAGLAAAQVAPSAEVEHLWLDAAGRGSLLVSAGQTLEPGTFRVSGAVQYSFGHLKRGLAPLLRDRVAVHFAGAVGLTSWLELSGELPVVAYQTAEGGAFSPSRSGLGTPYLHARIRILDDAAPVGLWAGVGVGLPVGTASALGNGGLAFVPRVNLGRRLREVQLGVELGALVRGVGSFSEVSGVALGGLQFPVPRAERVGSQLYLAGAVSTLGSGARGELSVRAFASLVGTPPGLELLLGARYPRGDVELFFVAGPGLGGAPVTPTLRAFAGVALGNGLRRPPGG